VCVRSSSCTFVRLCLNTDIDSIHLHTSHILLSSLPFEVFIFTKTRMNEDDGRGNIPIHAVKGGTNKCGKK
jgi:hypothetical protein